MVNRGGSVQDFLGETVKIGERLERHNQADPTKYSQRLAHISRTISTIREPDEIWLQQKSGSAPVRAYLRSFLNEKDEPRSFIVAVDHTSGEVFTHHISRHFKNREGTLIYAALVP